VRAAVRRGMVTKAPRDRAELGRSCLSKHEGAAHALHSRTRSPARPAPTHHGRACPRQRISPFPRALSLSQFPHTLE
jgi:hypothetical protein